MISGAGKHWKGVELEVLQRLQTFKLRDVEAGGFQISSKDFKDCTEECSRSLIGKLYGEKNANFTGLKNMLSALWMGSGQVKGREMGVNLYQFVFENQDAKLKVLNGKAWTFDSTLPHP